MADINLYDVVDDAERERIEYEQDEITSQNEARNYAAEDVELVPETIVQGPTPSGSEEVLNVTDNAETNETVSDDVAGLYTISTKRSGKSSTATVQVSSTSNAEVVFQEDVSKVDVRVASNGRESGEVVFQEDVSKSDVSVVSSSTTRETRKTSIQQSSTLPVRDSTVPTVMSGMIALPADSQSMPGPMVDRDFDNIHIRHLSDEKGHHSQVNIDGPKVPPVKYIHKTTMLDKSGEDVGTSEYVTQTYTVPATRRKVGQQNGGYIQTDTIDDTKYQFRISQEHNPHIAHVDIRSQRDDNEIGGGASLMLTSSARSSAVTSSNLDALYLETNEIYNSMITSHQETKESTLHTGIGNGVQRHTVSEGVQTRGEEKANREEIMTGTLWYQSKTGRWSPMFWCALCVMFFLLVLALVIIAVVTIFNRD